MSMFESKAFAIITGASKGLGRAIACSLAREFSQHENGKKSILVLVSRSMEGLQETSRAVKEISDLKVNLIAQDLSDVKSLPDMMTSLFDGMSDCDHAMLINNAASLGEKINSINNHTDVDKIREYMDLNITSCFYLTSNFIKHCTCAKKNVINISSKVAIMPMPSLSLYCSGKASRDMFHHVLAVESKDVRVLNYAPGPLKTEMFYDILKNSDSEYVTNLFGEMVEKNIVLDTSTTADRLMVLLKQDRYESGAHIDYFDELP